ncbi:MAG: biosynthetic peptidoglycan transglycosylase [candidate division KSB1 bacterium]|jgi:membrane peptidoglycan carboxypeptidase|nr:biosynthetic peptidoglycan transglycosylase [candidate division KSB1 bacterium]
MKFRYKALFIFIIILTGAYLVVMSGLPDRQAISGYQPVSTINAAGLKFWDARYEFELRQYVPLDNISGHLENAVIISEDDLFYRHNGVNYQLLWEALKENLRQRDYVRGAGTITMQLARYAFLTRERSLIRKAKEIVLAKRIESVLSKETILELYLNSVQWGPNLYGAEAASWYYFGKPASALDLNEASLLAGILINPERYNLFVRLDDAKRLQRRVLRLMRDAGKISTEEMEIIHAQDVSLRGGLRIYQGG